MMIAFMAVCPLNMELMKALEALNLQSMDELSLKFATISDKFEHESLLDIQKMIYVHDSFVNRYPNKAAREEIYCKIASECVARMQKFMEEQKVE